MTTQTKSPDVTQIAVSVGNRMLAAIFLIYFAPLMLAVAILIKLDSQGPVFMRQIRRRSNGDLVTLFGFRTAPPPDAAAQGWNALGSRQTELGTFLWETRLSLLPRLLNMLRGEVSLATLLR